MRRHRKLTRMPRILNNPPPKKEMEKRKKKEKEV